MQIGIEVQGNTSLIGVGRLRADRRINLNTAQSEDYATPPPLGDMHDPTVLRQNVQMMQVDHVIFDTGAGVLTRQRFRGSSHFPISAGGARPVLIAPYKLAQMGQTHNTTAMRFSSLLALNDTQGAEVTK